MGTKIEITNLTVKYGNLNVVDDVTTAIPSGKLTAIIGPNGAGKTTLLKCILGLVPYEGTIVIDGKDIRRHETPPIGYIPQHMDLDRGLPLKVIEFLSLGGQSKPLIFGISRKRREVFEHFLSMVNSAPLVEKKISELSGGELQRVLLAKSLCGNPDILLLDEPASGIDVAGEELFCDILEDIQKETGKTVVLVSHDLNVVTSHADFVLCLNKGIKCSGTTVDVMTTDNLFELFGTHTGFYVHGHEHEDTCPHDGPDRSTDKDSEPHR